MSQHTDQSKQGVAVEAPADSGPARRDGVGAGEEWARLALEAGRMGAWEWDLSTGLQLWSPEQERLFGLAPGGGVHTIESFLRLVHPEDREGIEARARQVAAADQDSLEDEFRVLRPDGSVAWFASRARLQRDAQGRVVRVTGVNMDVTKRKQAEERLRRLQSITVSFAASQTMAEVRQVILGEVMEAIGADAAGLRRLSDSGLVNDEFARPARMDPEIVRRFSAMSLAERHPAAEAARSAAAVFIGDAREGARRYPGLAEAVARQGTEASAHLPLRRGEEIFGVLSLSFPEPRAWETADREFALALAGRVAVAYERARLLEQERSARRAFEALAAQLHTFLDASPAGVAFLDTELRYRHINRRLAELNRLPPEAHLGFTARELWPNAPGPFEAVLRRVLETGEPLIDQEFDGQGEYAGRSWLTSYYPVREASGELIGVGLLVNEISDRKRAEEGLRAAQARRLDQERQHAARLQQLNAASLAINAAPSREALLRQILVSARELIGARQAVVNLVPDGDWSRAQTVVSMAEQYAAWAEYQAPPTGAGIYSVVYRERRPLRLTQAELEAHPGWRGFSDQAAAHPPLNGLLIAPLVDGDGASTGVLQLSDKAEGEFSAADEALLLQLAQLASVALENQLLYEQEQAARAQAEEASRLKDEFLATVSHELRTPLTAFLGYAQMVQRRQRDEAYVARAVEKMVRSAQAQAQIIDDLLDVSRIISGKLRLEPQPIDLRTVVRAALDTVRPAAEAKGLRLELQLGAQASPIVGDPSRLQQVMWNLLSNATKFTPPGGLITVRLGRGEGGVWLSVSDTGQGISRDFLPYVFDRFRQADGTSHRSHGGLGLGLAIVRHLVELHGGTIAADSAGAGQGATFTIRLPLALPGAAAAPTGAERPAGEAIFADCPPELPGLRVLIVDDQPDILGLLHEILAACGAVTRLCGGAADALEALRAWRPDVLISDIAMPEADGYWLIRSLRALPPDQGGRTPAIALTAYVRGEERTRVLAAGFQQYVTKPIEPSELLTVVASLARVLGDG